MIEPPYGVIWNRLRQGKVVPFLGAGASLAEVDASSLWDAASPDRLPRARELAEVLAGEASYPLSGPSDLEDLAKVCSYYADVAGRPVLRERLREVLNHVYTPGRLHHMLASVPSPLTIVTTNYDCLLEAAFRAAGKPYDLVIYPTDRKDLANAILWWPHGASEPVAKVPNDLDIDLATTNVIYKMHGTVDGTDPEWDSFVITEEDYVDFLSRMTVNTAIPSLFFQHFGSRSFLFLGYSLRDWNLRVVLKNMGKHMYSRRLIDQEEEGPLPSWAIQDAPTELERRLWDKRGISIFDVKLTNFVSQLEDRRAAAAGRAG
ncbi:MAG: SIR2 family protein [Chloroflexi bacterium]|nr:SIR2 family protein [Chloroflexota bacterium]MBV9547841.1 SIR2 family protein [Chloroflexota bacterium]